MLSILRGQLLSSLFLILVALGAGCTDSPTSLHHALSSRLVVQPRVDTLAGMGSIIHLKVTVDGRDTVASISWTSLNGGVATVDSLGTVRAVAAGTALIVAALGGEADTATLVVLTGVLVRVDLAPANVTLPPAGTIQFVVSGTWTDGSSTVPAVAYAATGGTITPDGLYTAGATPGTFAVIATQQGGSLADTSTVTIALSPPTLTQLVLTPASITLASGGTSQFAVSGTWSDGSSTVPAVTYSATGGTITGGGLYTAGTTPGTFQVIATQQGGPKADTSTVTVGSPSLRLLAAARGFTMGAAVNMSAFHADAQYRQVLATQYNSMVPEYVADFAPIHPGPTQYDFSNPDELVAFAQANGMTMHGHSLVWYHSLPSWLTSGTYTKAQLLAVLQDHIVTVVGHYRGKVASWDVVNEVINNDGTGSLRPSLWLNTIGPEYIDSAFVWAHRADPAAKLYLNDYSVEWINPKSDGLLTLAQGLRARGIPIDGVGFQGHVFNGTLPASSVLANFSRFVTAGFDIRLTEVDVQIADSAGATTLAAQGAIYRDMLDACLLVTRCTDFTTWGFTDRYSWIPSSFPGFGRGLPLDSAYQTKPAFDSLIVRLRQP